MKKRCIVAGLSLLLTVHPSRLTTVLAEELSSYSRALVAYQDRKLDEAFRYAQQAVREYPEHPDAHFLLGELYYLRQELTRARESWKRALTLAPSRQDIRERLEKLEKETPLDESLTRSDTTPFVVRFAEGQIPATVGELRGMLREAYRLIGQQMEYFPDHPITVLLYPEEGFEKVKGVSHQVAGLYDGKIRLPSRSHAGANHQLQRILWHEYTHALVHDLAKGRCPLWFNEGVASLQESRVAPLDQRRLREALGKGKLPSWETLWSSQEYSQEDLQLFYAQSYLVARYLVKRWGWRGVTGVLKRLGQGFPMSDALRAEFKADPQALEKEWLAWVKRNL